ncbi:MAG: hypothetical protein WEC75_06510 [Dehalococcoidia bacterium]
MPDYDAILLEPARGFYDMADAALQEKIDRIVRNICTDPFVDLQVKFAFPFPPYTPILYVEDDLYAVYDFENNWTLAIWNIGTDENDSLAIPKPPGHR